MGAPTDVWSADFKGHFKTGDGRYGYPLTITEGYRRVLLSCQALAATSVAEAKPVFTRVFKACGLPPRIRTDNGVPFATPPWHGCPSCLRGECAWASYLRSSNPANRHRTAAPNGCIAP
jgi:transposase InsO family protein